MERISAKERSSAAAHCARFILHFVTATGSAGFAGWSAEAWPVAGGHSTCRALWTQVFLDWRLNAHPWLIFEAEVGRSRHYP